MEERVWVPNNQFHAVSLKGGLSRTLRVVFPLKKKKKTRSISCHLFVSSSYWLRSSEQATEHKYHNSQENSNFSPFVTFLKHIAHL